MITRRALITNLTLAGVGYSAIGALLQSCGKEDPAPTKVDFTINLTDPAYSDLQNEGGFVYKKDVIVIRLQGDMFVGLSKICTHRECTVAYNDTKEQLDCPCHGSEYDKEGNVLSGPAKMPLQQYNTEKDGDELRVFSDNA